VDAVKILLYQIRFLRQADATELSNAYLVDESFQNYIFTMITQFVMNWMSSSVSEFHRKTQKELLKQVFRNADNIASFTDFIDEYGDGYTVDLGQGRMYETAEDFANSADAKCLYRCYPENNNPYLFLTINPGTPGTDYERSLHYAFEGDVDHIAGICRVLLVNWLIKKDQINKLFEELSEIATRGSLANYTDADSYFQRERADEWISTIEEMNTEEAVEWIKYNPTTGPKMSKGFLNDFTYDVSFNLESRDLSALTNSDKKNARNLTEERIRCIDPEVIIVSGGLPWKGIFDAMKRGDVEVIGDSNFTHGIMKARGGVFQGEIAGKRRTVLAARHPSYMAKDIRKKLVERADKVGVF